METDKPPKSPSTKKITEQEWMRYMFDWTSFIRKSNIQLQYYLKIDPYALSIHEWARKVKELEWLRKEEAKQYKV